MINQSLTQYGKNGMMAAMAISFAVVSMNSCALAQQPWPKRHPRQAQVLRRDNRINNRINNDFGHLGGHYGQLERQDWLVRQQDFQDARRNGGFITQGQQAQMNREENALSKEVSFDNTNNPFVQNHPRRAQVLSRDENLNYWINHDQGHLDGQYGNLQRQDNQIYRQEQTDARRNGGYITPGQQGQLNREESALGQEIRYDNTNNPFVQNHPRRSEVLARDANLNYSINKDEGKLHGQYGQLMQEDRSIAQQEQGDARANGGYITSAQQSQLNQEENQLRSQVQQDLGGAPPAVTTSVSGQQVH